METIAQEQTIQPVTKPRNVWIAFLFSLLAPGFGQLYNGQIKKATFFCALVLFIIYPIGQFTLGSFKGLVLFWVIVILIRIYFSVDAILFAKSQKDFISKIYNKWYYYIIYLIIFCIVFYSYRQLLGYYTFRVPSASNEPTVLQGDYVWADLSAYKNKNPDYGDFAVFKNQLGQQYVYRVVGLPNDRIALKENFIIINGQQCKTIFIKDIVLETSLRAKEYEEQLPNGHKHHLYILNQPFQDATTSFDEITIPSDSYFLIGDNRDNAMDSRYVGFINKQSIQGQLIYACWGKPAGRINIDFRDK